MHILGTVRVSLLHMVMISRMTLPVVPNIKRIAHTGTWNCVQRLEKYPCCCVSLCVPCPNWECNCSLYFCSLHNTGYYHVSTALSLTSPTTFPSLRSVCHIPALFPQTLSVCYDPDTIATLPAPDSLTVAGFYADTVRTVLAMLSIYLYLRGGADKSLARPTSRCRGTELIVSLERWVCSCANLQVFSYYRGWKEACQATRAISTTSRRELSSSFLFSCKARRRKKFTPFWQKH